MSHLLLVARWVGSPARLMIMALLAVCSATKANADANPIQCITIPASTPTLRGEAYADFVGDGLMLCQGGTVLAVGAPVPTVNITVLMNTAVTSRTYANGWSEALLIIDEPGSGIPGTTNTQLACNDPNGICNVTSTGGTFATYDGITGGPNVFPGQVTGNSVTFLNIPIDPPGPNGALALRITNIRVNASSLSGGPNAGPMPVIASISVSDPTVLAISNPTPTVGFVQNALSFSVRTPDNSALSSGVATNQCSGPQRVGVLRFGDGIGTAFTTRTATAFVDSNTSPAPAVQNFPGAVWDTESDFYNPNLTAPTVDFKSVGLADAGTRLRASINNIPPGASVYVSATGVDFSTGIPLPATTGLVASLTQNEALPFAPLAQTTTLEGIPAVQLPVTNGSAAAVWEVLASNPGVLENIDFIVWVQSGGLVAGTATVNGSFAPAPPAFTAAAGSAASSTLPVPRFVADLNPAQTLFRASVCVGAFVSTPVLTAGTPVYGNQLTFSATVSSTGATPPTSDTITFFDGSTKIGTANINSSGTATITTSSLLSGGAHSITAQFNGDANFGTSTSGILSQNVGKANTNATVSSASVVPGQTVTGDGTIPFSASFTSVGNPPTGAVSLTDATGNPSCQATLTAGTATCSLSFVTQGSHTITVNYAGDSNYKLGTVGTLTFQLAGVASTTTLVATPNPAIIGSNVTLTATVTSAAAITGGTVQFTNGGFTIAGCGAVPVTRATAQCVTAFSAQGILNLAASYSGDAHAGASSGAFSEMIEFMSDSNLTLTANQNPATVGQPVTFIATVDAGASGSRGPKGSVQFSDGSTVLAKVLLTNGQAGLSTTFSTAGNHTIFASYSGDSTYTKGAVAFGILVLRAASSVILTPNPNATVYGQTVTLTAQLAQGVAGVPAPTGQFQFFDGLTALGSVAAGPGTPTITVTNLNSGTHQLTVVYSGDNSWGPAKSAVVAQTVSKASTAITLTSTSGPDQATLNSLVTAASSAGTPGGGVQYVDAGTKTVLATATLAAGIAKATVGAAGRMIVAVYSGDANFLGSTSAPVLQLSIGNAASFGSSSFAPNEMVTLKGANLAGSLVTIADSAGARQTVTPSDVSAGQINFALPRNLASGPATVTVTNQNGKASSIGITIGPLAPGIFTANGSGKGTAKAVILDVGSNGTSTLNGANPIVLNSTDSYFVELFGTGFDKAKKTTVTVNGQNVPVLYGGPQSPFSNIDQINAGPLPASLTGVGTVNVQVTVDGQAANPVTLTFQ